MTPEATAPIAREIDAKIAEALGATWVAEAGLRPGCEWLSFPAARDHFPHTSRILAARGALASGNALEVWAECPDYSTDDATALEALASVGGIITIKRLKPDEWHVTIGAGRTVWSATLASAICTALLDAVASRPGVV